MLQTQVALSSLVRTGISFEAIFSSPLITLEDLEGFFRLLRQIVEAIEPELERELQDEVVLVSSVEIGHSSAKARVDLRKSGKPWNKAKKATAGAILVAALGAIPSIDIAIETPPAPISAQCAALLHDALKEHDANARNQRIQQRNSTIRFKAHCEGAYVESTYEPSRDEGGQKG